jgi:hypothetical protein
MKEQLEHEFEQITFLLNHEEFTYMKTFSLLLSPPTSKDHEALVRTEPEKRERGTLEIRP